MQIFCVKTFQQGAESVRFGVVKHFTVSRREKSTITKTTRLERAYISCTAQATLNGSKAVTRILNTIWASISAAHLRGSHFFSSMYERDLRIYNDILFIYVIAIFSQYSNLRSITN